MANDEFAFSLIYDGKDLDVGSIDARDLAPALIAFADLVDFGGKVLFPEAPAVTIRVRPTFRKGSFDVTLELAQAYDKFVGLFSGGHVQAWNALFTLLGISGVGGLLQFIKRARARKPKVLEIERSEKVRIQFEGEDPSDVPNGLWALFSHPGVRRSVEQIIRPLEREGIERLELKRDGKRVLEVTKEEAPYFKAPEGNENEQVHENPNSILVLLSPSFSEGNKWKVSGGTGPFWVGIEDQAFLAKVNTGSEAFRKGDILHVTLRTRQWMEGRELKAEHCIVEVHKHENQLNHPEFPGTASV